MYATLAYMKNELKETSTNATIDAYLVRLLEVITRRIGSVAGQKFGFDFEPYYETRYFSATPDRIDSYRRSLRLDDYLLEVVSITQNGTALTWNTDVFPFPRNVTPYRVLRLNSVGDSWYPCVSGSCTTYPFESIAITGWWGYKEHYATQGFLLSGDTVQNNPLAAGATSITVSDADGADALHRTPRFSPGNLLRIENEMFEVWAVDTTTNILSVFPGARGTTQAAHALGTAIKIWEPESEIQRITARWAAQVYARRGAFEQIQAGDLATVVYPADAAVEIYAALQRYANG